MGLALLHLAIFLYSTLLPNISLASTVFPGLSVYKSPWKAKLAHLEIQINENNFTDVICKIFFFLSHSGHSLVILIDTLDFVRKVCFKTSLKLSSKTSRSRTLQTQASLSCTVDFYFPSLYGFLQPKSANIYRAPHMRGSDSARSYWNCKYTYGIVSFQENLYIFIREHKDFF